MRHLVYDLLRETVAPRLSLDQLKHLFQQIALMPKPDYDTQVLDLIKAITLHAFTKLHCCRCSET